jgi:SHO1 osmosensor
MSPRLDFSPFRTHYFFLATTVLAALGWLLAFIFQAIVTAQFGHRAVGSLWFAILLQAALNVGVLFAVATDSIQIARLQLATFGAIATVFAVQGTDLGVFSSEDTLRPMGAGYLVLAIVDILWVLYFTSEADSLALHLINHLGTGGLAPPSRRRRSARVSTATAHTTASKLNYALGSGIGSPDMGMHEPKPASIARSVIESIKRPASVTSLKRSGTGRSNTSRKSLVGSIAAGSDSESEPRRVPQVNVVPPIPMRGMPNAPSVPPPAIPKPAGAETELTRPAGALLPGVIIVSPPPPPPPAVPEPEPAEPAKGGDDEAEEEPILRARALHAYKGSPDDPNELSFEKGEVLEIEDQEGKWWQAKKLDGKFGIVPSNYLVMI